MKLHGVRALLWHKGRCPTLEGTPLPLKCRAEALRVYPNAGVVDPVDDQPHGDSFFMGGA